MPYDQVHIDTTTTIVRFPDSLRNLAIKAAAFTTSEKTDIRQVVAILKYRPNANLVHATFTYDKNDLSKPIDMKEIRVHEPTKRERDILEDRLPKPRKEEGQLEIAFPLYKELDCRGLMRVGCNFNLSNNDNIIDLKKTVLLKTKEIIDILQRIASWDICFETINDNIRFLIIKNIFREVNSININASIADIILRSSKVLIEEKMISCINFYECRNIFFQDAQPFRAYLERWSMILKDDKQVSDNPQNRLNILRNNYVFFTTWTERLKRKEDCFKYCFNLLNIDNENKVLLTDHLLSSLILYLQDFVIYKFKAKDKIDRILGMYNYNDLKRSLPLSKDKSFKPKNIKNNHKRKFFIDPVYRNQAKTEIDSLEKEVDLLCNKIVHLHKCLKNIKNTLILSVQSIVDMIDIHKNSYRNNRESVLEITKLTSYISAKIEELKKFHNVRNIIDGGDRQILDMINVVDKYINNGTSTSSIVLLKNISLLQQKVNSLNHKGMRELCRNVQRIKDHADRLKEITNVCKQIKRYFSFFEYSYIEPSKATTSKLLIINDQHLDRCIKKTDAHLKNLGTLKPICKDTTNIIGELDKNIITNDDITAMHIGAIEKMRSFCEICCNYINISISINNSINKIEYK